MLELRACERRLACRVALGFVLVGGLLWGFTMPERCSAGEPLSVESGSGKPTPPEYSVNSPNAPIPRSQIIASDKNSPRGIPIPQLGGRAQKLPNASSPNRGTPLGVPIPSSSAPRPEAYATGYDAPATSGAEARYGDRYASPTTAPSASASSHSVLSAPDPSTSSVPPNPASAVPASTVPAATTPVPGFSAPQPMSVLTNSNSGSSVTEQAKNPDALEPVLATDQPSPTLANEPTPAPAVVTPESGPATPAPSSSPADAASVANVNTPAQAPMPRAPVVAESGVAESSSADNPPAESEPVEGEVVKDAPLPSPPVPSATVAVPPTRVATPAAELVMPKIKAEDVSPATFREIEPGVTTTEQLLAAWGEPSVLSGTEEDSELHYDLEAFDAVVVHATDGVVTSILIQLKGSMSPDTLAERLQLDFIRTVEVRDEQGLALGRAFPERGVLFSYDPAAEVPQVAQILLETIDPQAFSLRAETFWRSQSAASLADLGYVLENQPENAAAYHLMGRIYLFLGQVEKGLAATEKACALQPDDQEFYLTRAQCLAQAGDLEEAQAAAESVRDADGVNTLAKARALLLLGNLLTEGAKRDFKGAIELHLEAIKLAEPLAVDPLVATRRKAKEVLLDATLAVARDIAWGNWNRKDEVVPKWVERADAYARDAISRDGAGVELRVAVIERALAAHMGFKPAVDPARFLDVAVELTKRLDEATEDPLARQAAQWELGRIYNHAVRLAHLRGTVNDGLKYGEIAQQKLEQAAVGRESNPNARAELGNLYFHLGVLHAVHQQDHEKAVEWYDRAHALLAPKSGQATEDPGQLGEMLVSMGVSYWQVDLKQKALELTSQGAQLVKQAVDQGTLSPASLGVPYSNLASMHQELGHPEKAREIMLTAEKLEQKQRK